MNLQVLIPFADRDVTDEMTGHIEVPSAATASGVAEGTLRPCFRRYMRFCRIWGGGGIYIGIYKSTWGYVGIIRIVASQMEKKI